MPKRIIIELKDGRKLVNNPQYGWNLDEVQEIKNCLEDCGFYYYSPDDKTPFEKIYEHEVAGVYEEGETG